MTISGEHLTGRDGAVARATGMRILLVTDYYPPFIGGVQRQIRLLARELMARGHEVAVATVWSPGCAAVEDDGGIPVHRIRQLRSGIRGLARPGKHHPPPFPDPITVAGLRRVIRGFAPDVVHSYGWLSYSCAAAMLRSPAPLVVSARDYAYACATRTLLHEGETCSGPALQKCLACSRRFYGAPKGAVATLGVRAFSPLLFRRVDAVHSISEYVREVMRRDVRGARDVPHVVVPSFRESGEPIVAPEGSVPALGRLPETPFILFVGALRREKGIVPLVEAYGRLDDPPPLVLVGTREADTPASFPPGVVIVNDLPHAAVMTAWRRAAFGVAPSLLPEPLGSVVYEGMSMGKPVIGTVPGGHADMIDDGVSGLLVPAGDVDRLTAAMARLIADPGERERMGDAARRRAGTFTAGSAVPRLEDLYRRVVADRRRPRAGRSR